MKIAKKNLADIWEDMEWDEKSSDEMSWDEVQVWSVECGVWRVQCEVWGKCLHCTGVARRWCSYVLGHNTTTASHSFAQSTHAQPWLEHGACKVLSRSTGKWFMEACVTYEKRWDEKRWAGLRWPETLLIPCRCTVHLQDDQKHLRHFSFLVGVLYTYRTTKSTWDTSHSL